MNINSSFDPSKHIQDQSLRRIWQQEARFSNISDPPNSSSLPFMGNSNINKTFAVLNDDDLVSTVVPPVTVVLEGRSICQRINLHKHASYHSLAKALRQMFVDGSSGEAAETDLDLTNAVPGHLVAYEDIENDLLLAGDLNWKDFVRVAKRIRILPVKANSRKERRREGGA